MLERLSSFASCWLVCRDLSLHDAPLEPVWFGLADGGADISPLYNWEEDLPAEVVDAVNQARQDIIDGNLVVPLKVEPLE